MNASENKQESRQKIILITAEGSRFLVSNTVGYFDVWLGISLSFLFLVLYIKGVLKKK